MDQIPDLPGLVVIDGAGHDLLTVAALRDDIAPGVDDDGMAAVGAHISNWFIIIVIPLEKAGKIEPTLVAKLIL